MKRRGVISKTIARFTHDGHGIAAVEFAIVAPVLIALFFGSVTAFLLFRDSGGAEKATFTVADILSRQTTVNNTSLDTVRALFTKMLPDSQAGIRLHISSLKKASGALSVDWSYASGSIPKLTTAAIPTGSLPIVSNGDSLILVETHVAYTPLSAFVGLTSGEYHNMAVNRPRFTAAITKSD